jgi:acetyl-CoA acetyltransferase family protein
MKQPLIFAGARTPIGRAHKGGLVDVDAAELARVATQAAIERSGIDPAVLDDFVLAESMQGGGVLARYVAVSLGLTHVPGLAVNRHCAAGLGAIQTAAATIGVGMADVVLAGGTESMSSTPALLKSVPASARDPKPWQPLSHPDTPEAPAWDMSVTVGEATARLAGISRTDADAWAMRSHLNASSAMADGRFAEEIVPVTTTDASGAKRTIHHDEHPRPNTTMERLAALPLLHPEIPGAIVTAGNSAGLNDAAAIIVMGHEETARSQGVAPLARVVSWATVGVEPERTGLAPTLAIPQALDRAGMKLDDLDLVEINEAFASMAVASVRHLGLDPDRVNVNGSGCALGHPIAATGARMVVTMLYELRQRGASIGCVSMCAGGGMGSALILELL